MFEIVSWVGLLMAGAVTELALAKRHGGEPSPIGHLTDRIVQALTVVSIGGPPLLTVILDRSPGTFSAVAGSVSGATGVVLRAFAMAALGARYQLTPRPVKSVAGIVIRGPYAFVRHPGYSGLLLFFTGLGLVSGGALGMMFVAPLLLGVLVRIRVEEELLRQELGAAYILYRKEVRWKLIPMVL